MLSTHNINKSFYLCTPETRKVEVNRETFRLKQVKNNSKPIVFMIGWLGCKKSHINKYSKLYTEQGMDVLVTQCTLLDFFSIKRTQKLAIDAAALLKANEDHYKEIFIHSFSVGCPLWGFMQEIEKNNSDGFPGRVIGQVWDSSTNSEEAIEAIPVTLFPTNQMLQKIVKMVFWMYLNTNRTMRQHFDDGSEYFLQNRTKSPALIFCSKVDPVGTEAYARKLMLNWKSRGINVTLKCFDDSEHVKHYLKYPEEYKKLLHDHWDRVKLLDRK